MLVIPTMLAMPANIAAPFKWRPSMRRRQAEALTAAVAMVETTAEPEFTLEEVEEAPEKPKKVAASSKKKKAKKKPAAKPAPEPANDDQALPDAAE